MSSAPDGHVNKKPKLTAAIPIPKAEEEMCETDREMHRLRKDGHGWDKVVEAWERITGETKTKQTLNKRYTRMLDNFQIWPEEHEEALIEVKRVVESKLERIKWVQIADAVHAMVDKRYGIEALQKKSTELEKKTTSAAASTAAPEGAIFTAIASTSTAPGASTASTSPTPSTTTASTSAAPQTAARATRSKKSNAEKSKAKPVLDKPASAIVVKTEEAEEAEKDEAGPNKSAIAVIVKSEEDEEAGGDDESSGDSDEGGYWEGESVSSKSSI